MPEDAEYTLLKVKLVVLISSRQLSIIIAMGTDHKIVRLTGCLQTGHIPSFPSFILVAVSMK